MAAYSLDLRERIVAAHDMGGASRAAVATRFAVSLGFVKKLLAQRRRAGHVLVLPRGGGQKALFGADEHERLRAAVAAKNEASLAELSRERARGRRSAREHPDDEPGASQPGAEEKKRPSAPPKRMRKSARASVI